MDNFEKEILLVGLTAALSQADGELANITERRNNILFRIGRIQKTTPAEKMESLASTFNPGGKRRGAYKKHDVAEKHTRKRHKMPVMKGISEAALAFITKRYDQYHTPLQVVYGIMDKYPGRSTTKIGASVSSILSSESKRPIPERRIEKTRDEVSGEIRYKSRLPE